ncbi:hypothetical protein IHE45_16G071900 [Dioscorea alata]|uniref:Uncharacterized protein n=1 Tax=Dioscorea alata TaxID=55571 RepID=A0ACB7UIE5_DIOAL|nr:hypothetical protein IHE45_16G071900 [Dioscorea alata]
MKAFRQSGDDDLHHWSRVSQSPPLPSPPSRHFSSFVHQLWRGSSDALSILISIITHTNIWVGWVTAAAMDCLFGDE